MKEQFVTYEIALKLKELGFNKPCLASYYTDDERNYAKDGTYDCRQKISSSIDFDPFKEEFDNFYINSNETYYVSAPLWQQCIDWFREKHKIDIYPEPTYSLTEYSFKVITVHGKSKKQEYWDGMGKTYNTYQEAREQAILKAIELCQR